MGEMLGAIAHQWRQPLNALALIVQNLQDAQSFGELNKEYIEHAVQKSMAQIQHMSTTIEDFRNFFRPDRERTTFDAMRAVGEVLSLFAAQLSPITSPTGLPAIPAEKHSRNTPSSCTPRNAGEADGEEQRSGRMRTHRTAPGCRRGIA